VYLAAETAVSVLGITPDSYKSLADRSVANEDGVILQTQKQFVTQITQNYATSVKGVNLSWNHHVVVFHSV
jgi:hypothetical protein